MAIMLRNTGALSPKPALTAGQFGPWFYANRQSGKTTRFLQELAAKGGKVFGQLYRWLRRNVNFHLKSVGYYDCFGRRRHAAKAILGRGRSSIPCRREFVAKAQDRSAPTATAARGDSGRTGSALSPEGAIRVR
jgi:hypothetical protein